MKNLTIEQVDVISAILIDATKHAGLDISICKNLIEDLKYSVRPDNIFAYSDLFSKEVFISNTAREIYAAFINKDASMNDSITYIKRAVFDAKMLCNELSKEFDINYDKI